MDIRAFVTPIWREYRGRICGGTALALIGTIAIAPFTDAYKPFLEKAELRFLESENRAEWQLTPEAIAERKKLTDEYKQLDDFLESVVSYNKSGLDIVWKKFLLGKAKKEGRDQDEESVDGCRDMIVDKFGYLKRGAINIHASHCERVAWLSLSNDYTNELKLLAIFTSYANSYTNMPDDCIQVGLTLYLTLESNCKKYPVKAEYILPFLYYYWLTNIEGLTKGDRVRNIPEVYTKSGELNPSLIQGGEFPLLAKVMLSRVGDTDRKRIVEEFYPLLGVIEIKAKRLHELCRSLMLPACDNALTRYFSDRPLVLPSSQR